MVLVSRSLNFLYRPRAFHNAPRCGDNDGSHYLNREKVK